MSIFLPNYFFRISIWGIDFFYILDENFYDSLYIFSRTLNLSLIDLEVNLLYYDTFYIFLFC